MKQALKLVTDFDNHLFSPSDNMGALGFSVFSIDAPSKAALQSDLVRLVKVEETIFRSSISVRRVKRTHCLIFIRLLKNLCLNVLFAHPMLLFLSYLVKNSMDRISDMQISCVPLMLGVNSIG